MTRGDTHAYQASGAASHFSLQMLHPFREHSSPVGVRMSAILRHSLNGVGFPQTVQ